jgi:hypothetical protein
MQIRGTIKISEKKPDNEIKTTLIAFDDTSDGENVGISLKSSWIPQGAPDAMKGEMTGLLKGDTLTLVMSNMARPVQFRRATATEREEATRKLKTRAALNNGAY